MGERGEGTRGGESKTKQKFGGGGRRSPGGEQ
jgi:hypothetical protein